MKGNLLIVDDEKILVKRLKANLEELADTIYTAEDGLTALAVISSTDIHCIVCDINMPRMNGMELIRAVREQNNDVPFIFFTGHGNGDIMNEASRYGAFDFLNKPDFEGLEEVVRKGLKAGTSQEETISADFTEEMKKLK